MGFNSGFKGLNLLLISRLISDREKAFFSFLILELQNSVCDKAKNTFYRVFVG
jgi:hypothetical protein